MVGSEIPLGTPDPKISMVDVTDKPEIIREATSTGKLKLRSETISLIKAGKVAKGNPLAAAEVAAALAAKRTSSLIPLCHDIPITNIEIIFSLQSSGLTVRSTVRAKARTGVEMESLVATATALITVWDMVKQYEKDADGQYPHTSIEEICVEKKVKVEPT